jgi:hypothetical protein
MFSSVSFGSAEWDELKEEDKECDRQIGEAVKAALESSPSALIAAVEAMIQYQKMTITMWDTGGKYILANRAKYTLQDMNGVLNLLRSPPTEAAER